MPVELETCTSGKAPKGFDVSKTVRKSLDMPIPTDPKLSLLEIRFKNVSFIQFSFLYSTFMTGGNTLHCCGFENLLM